jgi:hypothetical protein
MSANKGPGEMELMKRIEEAIPVVDTGRTEEKSLSTEFAQFYKACLHRDFRKRPNYLQLLVIFLFFLNVFLTMSQFFCSFKGTAFLKYHDRIPPFQVWTWYERVRESSKCRETPILEIKPM